MRRPGTVTTRSPGWDAPSRTQVASCALCYSTGRRGCRCVSYPQRGYLITDQHLSFSAWFVAHLHAAQTDAGAPLVRAFQPLLVYKEAGCVHHHRDLPAANQLLCAPCYSRVRRGDGLANPRKGAMHSRWGVRPNVLPSITAGVTSRHLRLGASDALRQAVWEDPDGPCGSRYCHRWSRTCRHH